MPLNEADTKSRLIEPKLRESGWDETKASQLDRHKISLLLGGEM